MRIKPVRLLDPVLFLSDRPKALLPASAVLILAGALWPGQVRCDQCHRLCSLACPRSPLDLFFPAGHDDIPTFAGLGLDLDSRGPLHWALPHPVRERLCAARVGAHFVSAGLWFDAGCQCQPAEPCAGGTGGKGYLASCLRTSTGEPSGALVPALCSCGTDPSRADSGRSALLHCPTRAFATC